MHYNKDEVCNIPKLTPISWYDRYDIQDYGDNCVASKSIDLNIFKNKVIIAIFFHINFYFIDNMINSVGKYAYHFYLNWTKND
jgi:hypothetical protein